jgi:hypothetical protein
MQTIVHTSAGGTRSTYSYKIGPIDWHGEETLAIVVAGFPAEGGFLVKDTVANRILAEHPDVAAGRWAVFAKLPAGMRPQGWMSLGSGAGTRPLPVNQGSAGEIPADVIAQLHEIFGP